MKLILPFLLFLSATTFLFSQNESQLQDLVDKGIMTQEQLKDVFPHLAKSVEIADCESQKDSSTVKTIVNGIPNYSRRTIYEYNEQEQEVFQSLEASLFSDAVFRLRTTFDTEYSENESIIYEERYDAISDGFIPFGKNTRTYDSNDNVESYTENWYNDATSDYEPTLRGDYIYTSEGYLERLNEEVWDSFSQEYTPYVRTIYFRDENDQTMVDSIVRQSYDVTTQEWKPSWSLHVFFDTQGRVVEFLNYRNDFNGNFVLLGRELITYEVDSEDNTTHSFSEEPIGSGVLQLQSIRYNYYENGLNTIDSVYLDYADDGEFLLESIVYSEHDDLDRRILQTYTNKTGSGVFEATRENAEYYRECLTSSATVKESTMNCLIPNPLQNGQSMTCVFEAGKEYNLKFYDLFGRILFEETIHSSDSFHFDRLPTNGIYFLSIEKEGEILMQQKILVAN